MARQQYKTAPPNANIQGFTLIEVLIASLLLAIGLLGHMSMASTNLDLNRSGMYQTKATFLLNQMADRMRNNPTAVRTGIYDNTNVGPLAVVSGASQGCNPCTTTGTQAVQDILYLQEELRNFPAGITVRGLISEGVQITGAIQHELTITWTRNTKVERGDDAAERVTHRASMTLLTPTAAPPQGAAAAATASATGTTAASTGTNAAAAGG